MRFRVRNTGEIGVQTNVFYDVRYPAQDLITLRFSDGGVYDYYRSELDEIKDNKNEIKK